MPENENGRTSVPRGGRNPAPTLRRARLRVERVAEPDPAEQRFAVEVTPAMSRGSRGRSMVWDMVMPEADAAAWDVAMSEEDEAVARDVATPAPASEPAAEPAEPPMPPPLREGMLARLTQRRAGLPSGVLGSVGFGAPSPLSLNGCGCGDCSQAVTSREGGSGEREVSFYYLRPRALRGTGSEARTVWRDRDAPAGFDLLSETVPEALLEPVPITGTAIGHASVRCDTPGYSHEWEHPLRSVCSGPRLADFSSGFVLRGLPALRENAAVVWAEELEEARARFEEEVERTRQRVRVGRWYTLDDGMNDSHGQLVRVDSVEPELLQARGTYWDGWGEDGEMVVDVMRLGREVTRPVAMNRWPREVTRQALSFAGRVSASDLAPPEYSEDHECGSQCFEFGCSSFEDTVSDVDETLADGIDVFNHSYRPNLIFSGEGPLYLGGELELSWGHDIDSTVNRAKGAALVRESLGERAIIKSDGSIEGNGFEVMLHPMAYDWALQNMPRDLFRNLRATGARPHSSCGMHVHVSRNGFSDPVHTFKWMKFFYANEGPLTVMARRDPGRWGAFRTYESDTAGKLAKWHAKGGYGGVGRYMAINTTNRDTLEVRIFASTLNWTRYMGSLGLVDATIEYTRSLPTKDVLDAGGYEWRPFVEFAHSFEKYLPLQKEMARLRVN